MHRLSYQDLYSSPICNSKRRAQLENLCRDLLKCIMAQTTGHYAAVKKGMSIYACCYHRLSKVYNRFLKKQLENSVLCISRSALNKRLMGIHGYVRTSIDYLEGCRKTKVVASQERSPEDRGPEWKRQFLHIQFYPIPFCIFNFFPW